MKRGRNRLLMRFCVRMVCVAMLLAILGANGTSTGRAQEPTPTESTIECAVTPVASETPVPGAPGTATDDELSSGPLGAAGTYQIVTLADLTLGEGRL